MKKLLLISFLVALFSKPGFAEERTIQNLTGIDQLREAFQKDTGKVRIIALLSPT
jgi:hypothetical protein